MIQVSIWVFLDLWLQVKLIWHAVIIAVAPSSGSKIISKAAMDIDNAILFITGLIYIEPIRK